jgi:pyruvate,water dikinase
MSLVVFFDQQQDGLLARVGGKGSNLIALTAGGFPVPGGFVVTADAYVEFLDRVEGLDEELAAFDYTRPDVLRDQCTRLRKRLAHVALPETVQQAIHAALDRIAASADTAFAVRSSSTFEDLAQAAFAGQHDTYLNLRGEAAILEKVRDCFVSLWGDRAVLYRHHQGFAQREARMAVVVQRQVVCDQAGVGFSIDPVLGRLNRLVIDANYGLGESVVGGEFEVDHFELDKATLQVLSRSIGHKERMIAATAAGVEEVEVPPERVDEPCLNDEQLRSVAELIRRVEGHYGWPQDIEWGWKDGHLYLFQSRPVTTIQPRWTRDESAERFPNPMSPLAWDFIHTAFRRSLPHSMAVMGLPPLQGDWFQLIDYYIYGNQNVVELIAAYRPLRSRTLQELATEVPTLRQRYAWVLDLPVRWARDLDRYLIRLGRLSARDLEHADIPEIWRYMEEALEVTTEYFRPNIAISMTQAFLHRLLHGLVAMVVGKEQALAVADGLLAGCETKTAVVNRELHEMAQSARKTPALVRELVEHGGKRFCDEQRADVFPEFRARLARFLEDHGHREMDMDYLHPTWCEQPWVVLDALALILRSEGEEDPAETARRLRQRYAATEQQFLGTVPQELRFFFRELIRLARTYTMLDDLEHYQTTRINPLARRGFLALGQRLCELGVLDAAEDVFFFRKSDLDQLARRYPEMEKAVYRTKVYEAKAGYEAARRQPPPWSLDEPSAAMQPAANALRGLPGSPGRVTGRCFLVREPGDFARFPRGAVLVARTTNPAWTPLFYSAAALVTESGGPLSHGAVTAREMRLPAVMSVRGVMTQLQEGQVVTVDGTQGIVEMENA